MLKHGMMRRTEQSHVCEIAVQEIPYEKLTVDVRGLSLALHCWGLRSRPPLLLIHGFLDHGQAFAAIARVLAADYWVIAPDARGHGQSDWLGAGGYYHFYDYYFDAVAIVASLGLERYALVGHSMGGMIACGLAALQPDKVERLVLFDGMGPPADKPEKSLKRLGYWVEALQIPGFAGDLATRRASRKTMATVQIAADKLMAANPRLSQLMAEMLAQTGTEPTENGVVWRHDPLHRTPGARPFRVDEAQVFWQALTMPVLSIYATLGEWLPKDLIWRHQQLPQVTVAHLLGAGHNLHHEQPQLLAEALRIWLASPPDTLPLGLTAGEPPQLFSTQ